MRLLAIIFLIIILKEIKMGSSNNNAHKDHRSRVRDTYRKNGIENIPDHNLLEFILFYSIPRKDTNEIAHKLIDTFGSLNGVFDAQYERLLEVEGVGESTALLLTSIPDICKRYVDGAYSKKINLAEPEKAMEYVKTRFYGFKKEVFFVLCLDSAGNLINTCKMGEGTSDSVAVDKRAVLETVLRNNADTVIIAHNHPGGVAAPSREDLILTNDLSAVLRNVGIRLADHIIAGADDIISLASVPKFSPYFS